MTIDCKRVEISTHRSVYFHHWDQKIQKVKGKTEESERINQHLTVMKADLHKHYSLLLTACKSATAEELKNLYLGIGQKHRTLCEAIDLHNTRFAEKVKVGRKSSNTLKRLEITKGKIVSFLR